MNSIFKEIVAETTCKPDGDVCTFYDECCGQICATPHSGGVNNGKCMTQEPDYLDQEALLAQFDSPEAAACLE